MQHDHPIAHRAVGRPKIAAIVAAVARVAQTTAAAIRAERGSSLRSLAAWLGWNEGWITLRSIAASLRLRSEGHISRLIHGCEELLTEDTTFLGLIDGAIAVLQQ